MRHEYTKKVTNRYETEEERRAARKIVQARYRERNREKIAAKRPRKGKRPPKLKDEPTRTHNGYILPPELVNRYRYLSWKLDAEEAAQILELERIPGKPIKPKKPSKRPRRPEKKPQAPKRRKLIPFYNGEVYI